MKNKYIRFAGYTLLFVFFFFVFMYKTFPYDKLKKYIIHQIVSEGNFEIKELEIKSLYPCWFTGIEFENLRLKREAISGIVQEFEIDSGQIRISPVSLFKIMLHSGVFRLKFSPESLSESIREHLLVKYDFEAYDGGAKGYLNLSKPETVKFEAGKINLSKAKFLSQLMNGGVLTGIIKEMGVFVSAPDATLEQLSGNILFKINDGTLDNIKIAFVSIPSISVNSLNINLKARRGNVLINDFSITGEIEGKISGTVKLEHNFIYSKLNLSFKLKPAKSIMKDFSSIISTFIKPDSSGTYNFKLGGTFLSPEFEAK